METAKKNSLYLRKRSPKKASYIPGNGTFQLKPEKNLKSPLRKKFLIFQKMEPSNSKIKIFLIISQKKAFLIFSQKKSPPHFQASAPKSSQKISYIFSNKPLIFWETEIPKKKPLYFRKRNFLILQQRNIQKPSIFGTRSIFRILTYLEP